ncbi:MAG: hypothetical protein GFH27_549279n115 [Chloroflexi bacterium AL-W]|nr:hypothetical protein [Chloroflexi bacterium AL-N1]NOK65081.1 hypothetical protein [Chloroflexi bacterium AL-N10]NOK72652.1 hypothetical protein [Chloroflexi bacterium AL-N5]NOK79260.1 hypothetical protein [Chloroflexi bacterium AL-W]NOK87176.1 hypothetical protein [Chloroflexi bacterium AL-N15]
MHMMIYLNANRDTDNSTPSTEVHHHRHRLTETSLAAVSRTMHRVSLIPIARSAQLPTPLINLSTLNKHYTKRMPQHYLPDKHQRSFRRWTLAYQRTLKHHRKNADLDRRAMLFRRGSIYR